ncbi:MAG TPA: 50S ribosomal protein L24 [Armatimonadetes bacterium]|nr:50S ribosomal protein L24 [Armatimonadota bacterium]
MKRERPDTRHQTRLKVRLQVGDEVELISGKGVGRRGRITEIIRADQRVRVSGLAMMTKHQRARGRTRAMQSQTGRIELPGTIHVSCVQLVCGVCGKRTRPQFEVTELGKRRKCRQCGADITRERGEE